MPDLVFVWLMNMEERIRVAERNKVPDLLGLLSISSVAVRLEYPDIRDGRRLADEKNPRESQTPYLLPRP